MRVLLTSLIRPEQSLYKTFYLPLKLTGYYAGNVFPGNPTEVGALFTTVLI